MKKRSFLIALLLILSIDIIAQVGINGDDSSPDPSAMIDIKSVEKGMLIPRMTQLQITAIENPADGLLVYNTDDHRFYFFDGNAIQWIELAVGPGSLPTNCGTLSDIDGNVYSTVQIGSQCWMARNLETTKFNDGSDIPLITSNSQWNSLTTPGFCWYNDEETIYGATYGPLYNWYTVDEGSLCPVGWHVPTDAEWSTLRSFLGGQDLAGGKLKEEGLSHWNSPNEGATNETSFTGLPGGYRYTDGTYGFLSVYGNFWSASEATDPMKAFYYYLHYNSDNMVNFYEPKKFGYSVRCLKD